MTTAPEPVTSKRSLIGLGIALIASFVASLIGSVLTQPNLDWYATLVKPSFTPPNGAFPVVWTILFVMMAVAAWLVWRVEGFRSAQGGLSLFIVQLTVNALWTWIFFVWRLGATAFVEILLLWTLILIMTVIFWRKRPLAGILMIPYLSWVTYASALTYMIWRLNPHILS